MELDLQKTTKKGINDMKRIVLLFVVFVSICFPYKQSMHQYITAEAYKLLKNQLGYDIPVMVDKIGGTSTWYIGDRNWQRRYIATGAWREDVDDIVFGYASNCPPPTGILGACPRI